MKFNRFPQKTLWIVIVIVFSLGTVHSILKMIQEPSRENATEAVIKSIIVAAMIFVARKDLRDMDAKP